MQEIQQMEERAASLAAQAAQAEGLEGTVDEVVARQGFPCDPHSISSASCILSLSHGHLLS